MPCATSCRSSWESVPSTSPSVTCALTGSSRVLGSRLHQWALGLRTSGQSGTVPALGSTTEPRTLEQGCDMGVALQGRVPAFCRQSQGSLHGSERGGYRPGPCQQGGAWPAGAACLGGQACLLLLTGRLLWLLSCVALARPRPAWCWAGSHVSRHRNQYQGKQAAAGLPASYPRGHQGVLGLRIFKCS